MFRYVALVWNGTDPKRSTGAAWLLRKIQEDLKGYLPVINRSGLLVMVAGATGRSHQARVMTGNTGVILGSLFEKNSSIEDDSPSREVILGRVATDAIVRTSGRALISDYWGEYVGFITDDEARVTRVIKDPTGSLPCFYTVWRGITVVFSSICDFVALGVQSITVNWSYVASRIGSSWIECEQDALNEVSQVRRGECLTIRTDDPGNHSKSVYWNPVDLSERDLAIEDVGLAARALRATVRSTTHALAASHERIFLRLSGGLDSSIIAGCLRGAPCKPSVTACTYYMPQGKSDERRWARLAARHAGFEHIERPFSMSDVRLDGLQKLRPTAEPVTSVAYLERGAVERGFAASRGYTAVFNGDGGDSSFGSESIGLSVDDYLLRHGVKWGIVPIAAKVALCRDTLVWKTIFGALRRWCLGTSMRDFRERLLTASMLTPKSIRDTALTSSHFPHPWFRDSKGVPWCTIWRLGNLLLTPQFYDPFCDPWEVVPPSIAPLYSQPVVELALRIPIYVHFKHGHDRGLAREAFAAEIPEQIRRRRWKDRAPGCFEKITLHNRDFIREALIDGNLAKQRVIDPVAVEQILRGEVSRKEFFIGELFTYLDLEMWSRQYVGRANSDLQQLERVAN